MRCFLALSTAILALVGPSLAAPFRPLKRDNGAVAAVPAFSADFPDPSLLEDNGKWYAFATEDGSTHVQLATSSDFRTWQYHSGVDVLPQLPPWVNRTDSRVWAPKVWKRADGQYMLYYSALHTPIQMSDGLLRQFHCIGHAISSSPQGPFAPMTDQPLICPSSQGGAIDPSHFQDSDGQNYLVYKVDGNSMGNGGNCGNSVAPLVPTPIMLQKVADDGHTLQSSPIQILDRDDSDGPLVEAPSIAKRADGRYYLFYSSNCYSSPYYDISFATASSVTGPYTKNGHLFETGDNGLTSPGGADLSRDGTKMLFHAKWGNGRTMYAADLADANQGNSAIGFKVTFQ